MPVVGVATFVGIYLSGASNGSAHAFAVTAYVLAATLLPASASAW
jgi:hypothetical protein